VMIFQSVALCPEHGQKRLHRIVLTPADLGMVLFGEEIDEVIDVQSDRLDQQVTDLFVVSFAATREEGLAIGRALRMQAEAEGATCIDLDDMPEENGVPIG